MKAFHEACDREREEQYLRMIGKEQTAERVRAEAVELDRRCRTTSHDEQAVGLDWYEHYLGTRRLGGNHLG